MSTRPDRILNPVAMRVSGRLHRSYAAFAVVISTVWLTCLVVVARTTRTPSVWALMLLSALVVVTENRDRLFGDETSMSASVAVAICAVLVFRESAPLFGPLVCASCAGLYWPHLRTGDLSKVAVNSSSIGLSALAAAEFYDLLLGAKPSIADVLLVCVPMVILYWVVNSALLAIAMALLDRGRALSLAVSLVRSETEMLLFAMGGAVCGLVYTELNPWAGVLLLVAVIAAADRLVLSRGNLMVKRSSGVSVTILIVLVVGCLAASGAAFTASGFASVGAVAVGAIVGAGVLFCSSTIAMWRRLGSWELALSAGLVVPDLPLIVLMSVGGFLAAAEGVVVALAAVAAGGAVGAIALSAWPRQPVVTDPDDDLLITAAVELAILDRPDAPTSR
jgi:hypothetical protein